MTFNEFYSKTISSYFRDSKGQRLGQFFMNELAEYNIELYSRVPKDVDCFYNDKLFNSCTGWISYNWMDTCETVHDSSQ